MSQNHLLAFKNDDHFMKKIKEECASWDPKKKTLLFIEPYGAVNSLLKRALARGHQVVVLTANTDLRIVSRQIREAAHLTVQVDTANDRSIRQLGRHLSSRWRLDAVVP